jgi:hypothetical protein
MGLKRSVRGWMTSLGLRTPPATFKRRTMNLDGTITTGSRTSRWASRASRKDDIPSGRTRQSKVDYIRPTGMGRATGIPATPVSQQPPEFDYDEGNPPK